MRKMKAIIVVISLLMTTFVFTPSVLADGNWTIATVDSTGLVGADCSIAVGSNGYPYISYIDLTNGNLKCAKWTGSSWYIFPPVVSAGDSYTSIKLDSNGYPHISCWDGDDDSLMYAKWTGSSWSIETVVSTGNVGYQNCLALDSNNKPHIVYSDDTNPYYLKYAKKTGSSWEFSTIESGAVGCVSIDVDSSNYPHISYYSGSDTLKYAKWTGSSWSISTVDSATDTGVSNSIVLDSSNHPHISYYNAATSIKDLKYAEYTGSSWSYATVDSTGSVGMFNSIALDSSGNPRISYVDTTNSNLKFAKRTGSTWSTEVVDSAPTYIAGTGLAIDSSNTPHICYYDAASGVKDLKYAKCVSTDPILSVSTTTLNFGTHPQGWTGSLTFTISNSGGGTLSYSLSENINWISISPTSGECLPGESDTITVNVINTGSMSGYYSGTISISSNGGSASVFVDVTINPPQPILSYSPVSFNFGTHNQGWTGSSSLDIWNSGTGTLTYTLSESLSWITLSSYSGSSTGEHDAIVVSVVDTDDMLGPYSGTISISSNGGSGSISVYVEIQEGPNTEPYTPSNPYPSNNAVDIPIVTTLSWDGGDPNGDDVTYALYISACPQPDYFAPYDDTVTNEYYPICLMPGQTYYWKIVATDEHEAKSYGPIWSFSTKTAEQLPTPDNRRPNKPTTPTVYYPALINVYDPCIFTTTVVDPDGDNVNIYWDFDEDGTTDFELINVTCNTSKSILFIWDKPTGSYNIRVIATDVFGNASVWSDKKSIFVYPAEGNLPPTNASAPAGDSIVYKDLPCTFTTISYDPNGDDVKYQWDFNGELTSWDDVDWVPSGTLQSYTWIFDYTTSGNPVPIRVRAKDINNVVSSWSDPAYVRVIKKQSSTIFNRNTFCGFTYGDIFDNFPGSGRLIYANGNTGAIVTGAYGGFPYGKAWSTACQGIELHVGRTKTIKVDAEISYVGGINSMYYGALKKVIKVDGPYEPEQQYITTLDDTIGSIEDLQAISTAIVGLLKNGKEFNVWKLVENTLWIEEHQRYFETVAQIEDKAVSINGFTKMTSESKYYYSTKLNEVMTGGAYVPKRVSFETVFGKVPKIKPLSQSKIMFGNTMAGIQVAFETLTLYDLATHWEIDTLLKKFENSDKANTIHITNSFTLNEGDHTVWAGLQTEAEGLAMFFGFAYASGLVKSITIEGISEPDTPTLDWPDEIHSWQNIPFQAYCIDQNGDPVKYVINWGDGTTTTTEWTPCNTTIDLLPNIV